MATNNKMTTIERIRIHSYISILHFWGCFALIEDFKLTIGKPSLAVAR